MVKVKEVVNHFNEKQVMNNGMLATIISFKNEKDVDVLLEEGTICRHIPYQLFKEGKIVNIDCNDKKIENIKEADIIVSKATESDRVGMKKVMNNGLEATIVNYFRSNNIDVVFEGSNIVKRHVAFVNFKNGRVAKPKQTKKRIGEARLMNGGFVAEIIKYKDSRNCFVKFDDGTIKSGIRYENFKKGSVSKLGSENIENFDIEDYESTHHERVGETRKMNCGLSAKILRYKNYSDIEIEFEDGVKKDHVRYDNFRNGSVAHPKGLKCKCDNNEIYKEESTQEKTLETKKEECVETRESYKKHKGILYHFRKLVNRFATFLKEKTE